MGDEIKKVNLVWHEKIGKGSFGTVYLCENKDTGDVMAAKIVDTRIQHKNLEKEIKSLFTEMENLKKIKHKYIVRYYGMLRDHNSISLLMEYVQGGTISDLISKKGALGEEVVSYFSLQILEGLAYLHQNRIVHRDIKCANILLDKHNNCKLADFGTSKHAQNIRSLSGCDTFCGTIHWMSPECMQSKKYGSKSDIWSFGCTVIQMLTTKPPFFDREPQAAMYQVVFTDVNPSFPPGTSGYCKEFINDCFERNPQFRPSAKQLLGYNFLSMHEEWRLCYKLLSIND